MSLIHAVTGEQSRLRRWALYLFARYAEIPLLAGGYQLLRGRDRRWSAFGPVRALLIGVVAPLGYLGDTARPVPEPEVVKLIDRLEGPIAVGPCRCRSAHRGCKHPLDTDIVIRTGVEAWTRAFPREYRRIDKEEAKRIVTSCGQLGMWPMVFVHCPVNRENEYVICNCCTCGCMPYILNRELGQRVYPLLRGSFVAETDLNRCTGHGACVAACPFGVRAIVAGKVAMLQACYGCGLCVAACPEGAIQVRAVSDGEESP